MPGWLMKIPSGGLHCHAVSPHAENSRDCITRMSNGCVCTLRVADKLIYYLDRVTKTLLRSSIRSWYFEIIVYGVSLRYGDFEIGRCFGIIFRGFLFFFLFLRRWGNFFNGKFLISVSRLYDELLHTRRQNLNRKSKNEVGGNYERSRKMYIDSKQWNRIFHLVERRG